MIDLSRWQTFTHQGCWIAFSPPDGPFLIKPELRNSLLATAHDLARDKEYKRRNFVVRFQILPINGRSQHSIVSSIFVRHMNSPLEHEIELDYKAQINRTVTGCIAADIAPSPSPA